MRRLSIRPSILVVAVLVGFALPAGAQTVTVTAKRLLNVTTGKVVENPVVRIENGVVKAVEPRSPEEAVTLALGDVTLLPGLVDCHTHLIGVEEDSVPEAHRDDRACGDRGRRQCPKDDRGGVHHGA